MLEKYCDILVIGTELPGLITAAFLARRGLTVQVVDTSPFPESVKLPDPIGLTNVHSKLLRSILGRLNVPEMSIQGFNARESTLQVVTPKHRIDVSANPLLLYDELDREFPEDQNDIKRFLENQARIRHQTDVNELFQHLLPTSWKERRQLKKFIKAAHLDKKSDEYELLLKKSPLLAAFLKAQQLLARQCLGDGPFEYHVAELFNPTDGEIFSVHPGSRHLKKLLLERLTQHDGQVRHRLNIEALLYNSGIFEGVSLGESQGQVLAKYLVWNTSLGPLTELLPRKWRYWKMRRQCAKNNMSHHWFTARYVVPAAVVPEPMKDCVLDLGTEFTDPTGGHLCYYQLHRDLTPDMVYIDVSILLPADKLKASEESFENYFSHMRERLLFLIPFAGDNLKRIFPIASTKESTGTLFPLDDNDFDIFKLQAKRAGVHSCEPKRFIDLFNMHYNTPSPNFYLSNPEIFSHFGLESKLMLGLKITDIIWQEVDKTKKRAMKSERRIA